MKALVTKDRVTVKLELINGRFSIVVDSSPCGCGTNYAMINKTFGSTYELFCKLHLASDDGIPYGDGSNGWYWYGGTPSQAFHLEHFANHVRVIKAVAQELRDRNFTKSQFMNWFWRTENLARWRMDAIHCINQIKEHEVEV